MEKHIQILGILYIVLGVMGLFGALVTFVSLAGVGMASEDAGSLAFLGGLGLAIAMFIAILSLPGLLGGYGLLKRYHWSRILVLILSFLNLINLPFGTAVGIYGIWVLPNDESIAILEGKRNIAPPPPPGT